MHFATDALETERTNLKVLLLDDHAALRLGVVSLIKRINPQADVLQAATCQEALTLIEKHPDVALIFLDLDLPDRSGFDVLTLLRAKCPRAAVAILSGYDQRAMIREALMLGAMAFIPKKYSAERFERALMQVLNGQPHVPDSASVKHEDVERGATQRFFAPRLDVRPGGQASLAELGVTQRETEVMRCLIEGWSNKEICDLLDMKEGTAKTHIASIYRKLAVTSRLELMLTVQRLGVALTGQPARFARQNGRSTACV
jgi:DNA-binding NarL/FixJ family response regulator